MTICDMCTDPMKETAHYTLGTRTFDLCPSCISSKIDPVYEEMSNQIRERSVPGRVRINKFILQTELASNG